MNKKFGYKIYKDGPIFSSEPGPTKSFPKSVITPDPSIRKNPGLLEWYLENEATEYEREYIETRMTKKERQIEKLEKVKPNEKKNEHPAAFLMQIVVQNPIKLVVIFLFFLSVLFLLWVF